MKKLKILALSLLGIVVFGYIILFVVIRILFPPERLKEIITPKISQAVGRDVNIEGAGISIFPGLSLRAEDLTIANAQGFSDNPMLKVNNLYLSVKLLPLLKKRVEVESILFKNPKILIEKSKAGTFNFEMAGEEKENLLSEAEASETSPVSLLVNSARIEDGTLLYLDHQMNNAISIKEIDQSLSIFLDEELKDIRAQGQIDMKGIGFRDIKKNNSSMNISSVTLKHNFKINTQSQNVQIEQLQLAIASSQLNFTGSLKNYNTTPTLALSLRTNEIELSNLLSIIPKDKFPRLKKLHGAGKINLKMVVNGELAENKIPRLDGELFFNNLSLSHSELPVKISNLNGRLGLNEKSLNIRDLKAKVGGNSIELSGLISDFKKPRYDLKLKVDLNLSTMKDYLEWPGIKSRIPPDKLPMLTKLNGEGKINLRMEVLGEISDEKIPRLKGEMAFNNLTLTHSERPGKISNLNGRLGFSEKSLTIRNLTARLGSDPVELSGAILDFEHPRYELILRTDLDLNAMKNYMELPKGTSLSGRLKLNLTARGSTDKPENTRANGKIHVSHSSFTSSNLNVPLTDINCEIILAGRKVQISNFRLRAAKSSIALNGEILDPVNKPKGTLQLTSSLLDLDEIFPETESEEGEEVGARKEPIKLPFETLDGEVKINKLITNKIVMNKVHADVIIRNNILSIKNFRSNLYSGEITGNAKADFNDPSGLAYTIQMDAENLDVNDFATPTIPLKDAFFGKMQLKLNAKGTGLSRQEIKKNIVAEGTTVLFNGKIINLPVLHSLANFLNLPTFEAMSFKTISNSFTIRNNKLAFEKFELKALDNDISLHGFIGLDGALDLFVSMVLSEKLTQRFREKAVRVPKFLLVDSNRLPLDFIIKGTKEKPVIQWDTMKALSRTTRKTLQSGLEKIFGGINKAPNKKDNSDKNKTREEVYESQKTVTQTDSLESDKAKKEADPLKKALKGLFKKKKKKPGNR